jgi:hypothetical protein
MTGAMAKFRKPLKKTLKQKGKVAMASEALAVALEVTKTWDDGTWFEMWASAQTPGKEEMMSWGEETMKAGPHTDYEKCRAAFMTCVYLELMGWDVT